MFPINLLIVSIFRNTRPREKKPGQPKTEASKQGKTGRVSPSQPPSPQMEHEDITPDTVIKVDLSGSLFHTSVSLKIYFRLHICSFS